MSIYSIRKVRNKQTLQKYILYCILALAFFIPLNDAFASVALLLGILLTCFRFFLHRLLKFKKLPFDIPILIFACISLLSCLNSPDKFFSFYNCTHTLGVYILVYILIGQGIENYADVKKLLFAILAGFSLCVLYGLYQATFVITASDALWVDSNVFPELKRRITGTLQNPNIFAGYITMVLAILLGLFTESKAYKEKALYLLIMLVSATALVFTYSRAAMLTIFIVLIVLGILRDKSIIVVSILVAIVCLIANPLLLERMTSIFTTVDTSTEMRLAFYEATLAMIEDHPILGCGWGAYFMVYPEYDFYLQGADVKIVHAHNVYLNYVAEVGIIGAAAFFWFFFGSMRIAFLAKLERDLLSQSKEKLMKIAEFMGVLNLIKKQKAKLLKSDKEYFAYSSNETVTVHSDAYASVKEQNIEEKYFTFEGFWNEVLFQDNESIKKGLLLGIGLMFLTVAVNGLFDDLLFNIPTSMFLWLLAAFAAKILALNEE